jgi:hypothetical protein
MDAHFEKINASFEEMRANMDAYYERMVAIIKECLGRPEAKKELAPEETEAMAEPQEVPEGATDEEMSGGTEDRAGKQHLAVRRHGQLKKQAQGNGGPRQKFAAARGWFTRCAIPALIKGHARRGPGMKCRRSGLKGQSKAFRKGKRVMLEKGHLERRKALYDAVEPTLGLEIAKRVVGTSFRLWEPGDWLLWKCRPPPKQKR